MDIAWYRDVTAGVSQTVSHVSEGGASNDDDVALLDILTTIDPAASRGACDRFY